MLKKVQHNGFTIVELLVSIVIIGILATIVYLSYDGYERRAQTSKIASVANTYQDAINAVARENDQTPSQADPTTASCLSSDTSTCCVFTPSGSNQIFCGTNANLTSNGYQSSEAYTEVNKHLPNTQPRLPANVNNSLTACGGSGFSASPCKTNEIGYISTPTGDSPKGALVYYLSSLYECGSNDVLVYNSGTYSYSPQKYSRQTSAFTECIIGIR